MVKYRSEISRSRTGIHGGVRRGSAVAAIGAVLVLTAGVPASQADGGSGSEEPDVGVTGSAQLPRVGGLLQGLLGDTAPASEQPTPVPETTTASPAPAPTSASPAPSTASPSPTSSAATSGTATPAPATAPGTAPAAPLRQPATSQPGAATGVAGSGADTPTDDQPAAGTEGAAPATSLPTAGTPGPTATSRTGVPQAVGGAARSRQEMTAQAEPEVEAAKVWLGVGLLGSAGAAGLIFTRIRQF